MKIYLALPIALALAACGGQGGDGETSSNADDATQTADAASGVDSAEKAKAANAKLPFDLPMAPETRFLHEFRDYERKGQRMADGVLAAKQTPQQLVAFYKIALAEAGFQITSENDYESTASLTAKRGQGDEFSLTSARSGSGVEEGESQTTVIVKYAE